MNTPVQLESCYKPMETGTPASVGTESFRSVFAGHMKETHSLSLDPSAATGESVAGADGSVATQSHSAISSKRLQEDKKCTASETQASRAEVAFAFPTQPDLPVSIPAQQTVLNPSVSDVAHSTSEVIQDHRFSPVPQHCSQELEGFDDVAIQGFATGGAAPSNSIKAAVDSGIPASLAKTPLAGIQTANKNGTDGVVSEDPKSSLLSERNRTTTLAASGSAENRPSENWTSLPLTAEQIRETRIPAANRSDNFGEAGQNHETGRPPRTKDFPATNWSQHHSQSESALKGPPHTSSNGADALGPADVTAKVHASDAKRSDSAIESSIPAVRSGHIHSSDERSGLGQMRNTAIADTGNIISEGTIPNTVSRRLQPASSGSAPELPERLPLAPLSSARLIERVGESELRIGMRSGDLGPIEIRTSIANHELTAQISVSHADLSAAIAAELPALQTRLQAQHSPTVNLLLQDSGGLMSGGSGAGAQQQPTHQQAELAPLLPVARTDPTRGAVVNQGIHGAVTAGVDIHV